MKRSLLTPISDVFPIRCLNLMKVVLTLLLLLNFGLVDRATAQCIGPYQVFESIKRASSAPFNSLLVADSWSFSTTSPNISTTVGNARSGANSILMSSNVMFMQTPVLTTPKDFSFYYRNTNNLTNVTFKVEYASETDPTFLSPIALATLVSNANTYTNYTVDLSTLSNVYVRITWVSSIVIATGSPATSSGLNLFIDDISWTSSIASQNKVIVPAQSGNTTPLNCSGGTITLGSSDVYNFYDNGGDSDNYNLTQSNQVTFKPLNYALGDRIRIQFLSYKGDAGEQIDVWDNNGTGLTTANKLSTATGAVAPSNSTCISTVSTDGSITIKFTSDGANNAAGFNIKVDCVRCPTPTGLAVIDVGSTTASLEWDPPSSAYYDIYYSTSNTPPTGVVTPQGLNSSGNSYDFDTDTLTSGTTYYVWVRRKCSTSSPISYSPWSSAVSFTTVDCSAFVITSPSTASQSLCLNGSSTALTVLPSGAGYGYQWYSYTTASNSGGTLLVGATSASYTPLTTTAGTLYYYCEITSTTPACFKTSAVSGSIVVTGPPSAPFATAATTVTTNSFTANWNAVAGATGYFLDVSTVNTFASFVTGFTNLSVWPATTRSVTGLSPGVTYFYRVRAVGTCGTSVSSNIINPSTVGLSYCIPLAPSTTTSFVDSFSTTGGITNITNTITGFTTGGYANYSSQFSCSQYPSSSINYSITSKRTDSLDQTFFYYIWIDWNNDVDFTDAGETIVATTSYQGGPFTGTIAVPTTQAAGNYRMRVSTSWVGANTSCAINATYGRGEMEDYTFIVVPVPPCAPSTPSLLTTASVTATTAILSWTDAAMTPNSVYDYYWSLLSTPPLVGTTPSGTVTGATSATITGLTVNKRYYFWVRSNCGTPNAWEGPSYFDTVNQDVVNMTTGSITSCSVKFYDSAGPVSNYSNNENFTFTFKPSSTNSKLKVVFNSFATENNWDGLVIYNGNSTAAPIISSGLNAGTGSAANCPAGSFYGTVSPGTITSTADDGSLTFQFRSDDIVRAAGWDAVITCVAVPTITSFTPTGVCVGSTPTVTLTGVNFTGVTSVKFNGVNAVYTFVSDTSITTTLPSSATTGNITVTTATATGTSATVFIVSPLPSTPNAGSNVTICDGTTTTLNGSSSATNSVTVFSEDFNAASWPSTWSRTQNGGYVPGDFRTSSEFLSSGNTWAGNGRTGFCSYFYSYLITNGVSGDMVTPAIDLSSFNSASLTFWIYNSSGTDLLKVYANNNNGLYTQVGSNYATYGSWTQITISLNAYTGTGFTAVRLKFTGTSDGIMSNIGIDDVLVAGGNSSTFVWSPAASLSSATILNPVANPTTDTTYTLTTAFGSGCSATSSVTVFVIPKPTVTITTAAATICANSIVAVTSSGTASTYSWTSSVANTLFSDAIGTIPYVAGTNATSVYVKTPSTVTITLNGTFTPTGCIGTASVTFTVVPKIYNGTYWIGGNPTNNGTENLVFPSGTFTSTGNLNACSCTVLGGTVIIDSGHTVTLQNGLLVSSGSMTFNSGASLVQVNNVANSGNITYKRDSTPCFKSDYTYWSSPVASQTLIGLSPATSSTGFYDYDNITTSYWQASNSSSPMTIGKGYLIRVPYSYPVSPAAPQIFTANFIGVPNNGEIPFTIFNNPANYLTLLGNPYPSALSGNLFVSANTLLDGTLYFWTHNTSLNLATGQYIASDYAVWNSLGGTGTGTATQNPGAGNSSAPTGNIASGQGFFINTNSSGTAYFRNSMRLGGSNTTNFYRNSGNESATNDPTDAIEKHRVWLAISDASIAYKQLLVGYIQDGTDGLDRLFDGKMVDNGNQVTFYTRVDEEKLTIQGRGLPFSPNDVFPLGYKSTVATTYSISLSDFDGLFTSQAIYLEDTLLHVTHDLKTGSYSFATEAGTFENRFVLRFTNQALGVPVFSENTVVVYKNEEGLYVNSGTIPMSAVAIFDVSGRLIAANNAINNVQTLFTSLPLTNQVLLVHITSETGGKITKKVVY
jgi:hypothetical protein